MQAITIPPFNSALGMVYRTDILVNAFMSGSMTVTLYGLPPEPEVSSFGISSLNISMTLLNNGSPIANNITAIHFSSSCDGTALVVSCTQTFGSDTASASYLDVFAEDLTPESIGDLQILIEPMLFADIHISGNGASYENYATFETMTEFQFGMNGDGAQVDYYYTPVSQVPLPGAFPLLLASLGFLGFLVRRNRMRE